MSTRAAHRRVLIILPDAARGGGHSMNFRLAEQLADRGWLVTIVILFDRCGKTSAQSPSGVKVVYMHADRHSARLSLPLRLAFLAKGCDIVVAGLDLAATSYGYAGACIARRPFVSWMHIAFHEHMRSVSLLHQFLSCQIYRRVRHIVFPSRGSRESLATALGGIPRRSRWHVIDNFNDIKWIATTADQRIAEHIFAKPVVMSIGRLVAQKAYGRLIGAHKRLLAQGLTHHLVILGDGPERSRLQREIDALNLSSTVFLPGHVENPIPWLRRATAFALCSQYEGLPLVLLEAMQEGVPIVAMDCPSGPREILQAGAAGKLTPRDDELAFQDALGELLSSEELRAFYARKGRERAHYYSAERIVPLWEDLLTSLIE